MSRSRSYKIFLVSEPEFELTSDEAYASGHEKGEKSLNKPQSGFKIEKLLSADGDQKEVKSGDLMTDEGGRGPHQERVKAVSNHKSPAVTFETLTLQQLQTGKFQKFSKISFLTLAFYPQANKSSVFLQGFYLKLVQYLNIL